MICPLSNQRWVSCQNSTQIASAVMVVGLFGNSVLSWIWPEGKNWLAFYRRDNLFHFSRKKACNQGHRFGCGQQGRVPTYKVGVPCVFRAVGGLELIWLLPVLKLNLRHEWKWCANKPRGLSDLHRTRLDTPVFGSDRMFSVFQGSHKWLTTSNQKYRLEFTLAKS